MAVLIKLRFPAGRYHATPWGRHVNEGVPEWPPSPWRLLRALVAVWKRTYPDLTEKQIRRVLEQLLPPPRFQLPPFRVAHTRHYMPLGSKSPKELVGGGTTLVFDTFVSVSRNADLYVGWPAADLASDDRSTLARLLGNLTSLGRAEGWIHAELVDETVELDLGPAEASDPNPVPVFCPDPSSALADEHFPSLDPKKLKKGLKAKDHLFECPRWHLCLDTQTISEARWPRVPGAMWVNYTRPSEVRTAPKALKFRQSNYTLARYVLDAPVLPLVTETLPLAEELRRQLLRCCRAVLRRRGVEDVDRVRLAQACPNIVGKTEDGRPLRDHGHARFLPVDEDGDGRIDHVVVFAEAGFNGDELAALDRLRLLPMGDRECRLLRVGLGQPADFRGPLFGPAAIWLSATPFVVTRYPKRRGRKRDLPEHYETPAAFAYHVLSEDLDRLRERLPDLPQVIGIDAPEGIGAGRLRPIQFKRFRSKPDDDGGRRPTAAFRIRFARPIVGPLCLGHGAHFGLGLFVAQPAE